MLMQDVLLHKLSYQRLPVLVGVWLNRSNWVEDFLWNSLGRIQEKMLRLLLIEPLTVSFSGKIIFLCQKNHNHLVRFTALGVQLNQRGVWDSTIIKILYIAGFVCLCYYSSYYEAG